MMILVCFFEKHNLADLETVTNLELNKISKWFKIKSLNITKSRSKARVFIFYNFEIHIIKSRKNDGETLNSTEPKGRPLLATSMIR